ncbi:MAG: thioredoxin domain-containing protein [Thermoproteus sp. AZ2]|uniref:Thioredoxin domain-containing protein n=1 Tax=Thermoproteus sp. AZ2 TaxID=1609232 RepID=A0ACC6V1N7_9CREN
MKGIALAAIIAAVAAVAIGLAYYFTAYRGASPGPSQPSVAYAYISAAASPAPLLAIQYLEHGQYMASMTYQGQEIAVGERLTPQQSSLLSQLVANSTLVFGSPNAKIVVLEYLDPTCPYCAIFSVEYFSYLHQYIENGTVLYVVRYMPTHVWGYIQQGSYYPQSFIAGVDAWPSLECIYQKYGAEKALNATETIYDIAAYYIYLYTQTNNATYLVVYPLAEKAYLDNNYPQCAYNLTLSQAQALAQAAYNQATSEASALGVPNNMLGTPLFIVTPRS